MPKDPKGRKRPADVIGNAVHVMRIATGEVEEPTIAGNATPTAIRAPKCGVARAKRLTRSTPRGGRPPASPVCPLAYLMGEKSVGLRNTDSTFTTDGPSRLVASRMGVSAGSARKASHDVLAASRLWWATM